MIDYVQQIPAFRLCKMSCLNTVSQRKCATLADMQGRLTEKSEAFRGLSLKEAVNLKF